MIKVERLSAIFKMSQTIPQASFEFFAQTVTFTEPDLFVIEKAFMVILLRVQTFPFEWVVALLLPCKTLYTV